MKETKSNWACVANAMKSQQEITLGRITSNWIFNNPLKLLRMLSFYKFAARMIGTDKRVLDIGCNEGLGTWVLSKECGFAKGIDFDLEAVHTAKSNFRDIRIEFSVEDILNTPPKNTWDALVIFDTIGHIYASHAEQLLEALKLNVSNEGLVIIGIPNPTSQQFASNDTQNSRSDAYSQGLEEKLRRHFEFVFIFAANNEIVPSKNLLLADYLIAIASKKKNHGTNQ